MERNVAENDGFGNAQANVRHHAQARFTKHLFKEGEHNPMPRRGVQRHDFCATTFRSDFTCSDKEGTSSHIFSCGDEVRVSFFPTASRKRGHVTCQEFVGSLRPEQTRLFFMCLPWQSWRKDDFETTEQWRNRCSFAENILDEEFVLCAFAPNFLSNSTRGSGTDDTAKPQTCEGQNISSVSHMHARQ